MCVTSQMTTSPEFWWSANAALMGVQALFSLEERQVEKCTCEAGVYTYVLINY